MTDAQKAALSIDEAIELMRYKPVNSTLVERWQLISQVLDRYSSLPQPLFLGHGLNYIVEHASLPTKEYDLLLGRFDDHVPSDEEEKFLRQTEERDSREKFAVDGGHITLNWETIFAKGLTGLKADAEAERQRQLDAGAPNEKLIYLESMSLVYNAYIRFAERYADAAEKAGLKEQAEVCRALTAGAPATFHQALQLVVIVMVVYYIYASAAVSTLSLGRLDDLLAPLYEADLTAGRITEEKAGYLIDDLNCKCSLPLGRGEHQMAGGEGKETGWFRNPLYDSPTYIIIGGCSNRPSSGPNPLTKIFVEHIHPRFENPVYIYRRTPEQDENVWLTLCDRMRKNASIIVYNDETVIPAMIKAGIEPQDAVNYSMHACNWPDISGKYCVTHYLGGPIPAMILDMMLDEQHQLRKDFLSMDSVYEGLEEYFRTATRGVFEAYRENSRVCSDRLPTYLTCTDCFTDGTIEHANTMQNGGAKYRVVYTLLRNIGTAADMFSALDQLVFRKHSCSLAELVEAMRQDFAGYETLLHSAKHAPKFGTDNDFADMHARRIFDTLLRVIDEESCNENGERDVISLNLTITDMWHVQEGAKLIATFDGRRSAQPLSENLSPTVGVVKSVTALLNSIAKLPLNRISSGALNVRLASNVVSGDEGLARLRVLMDTYFEKGGMQIQLSVSDTAQLRAAQEDPESFRDLMVRITGYSAVFVDMSRRAQDELIRRDELS